MAKNEKIKSKNEKKIQKITLNPKKNEKRRTVMGYKKLEELEPYLNNPRKINETAISGVAESIKRYGMKQPIVVDKKNVIIVGHTRTKALQKLREEGYTGIDYNKIPCIIADDLTPKEVKAYRLADNKLNELTEWDDLKLTEELKDLNMDMSIFGFDNKGLNEKIEVEEVDMPELRKTDIKLGDMFQLGDHRILCGSSTNPEDVKRLLGGETMDLCVTDPPYNINYKSKGMKIENDNMSNSAFKAFLTDFYTQMRESLKAGGAFYIFHPDTTRIEFETALNDAGMKVKQTLIWNKNSFTLSGHDYQHKYEAILYGSTEGGKHYFIDERNNANVIDQEEFDIKKASKEELQKKLEEILGNYQKDVIDCPKPQKNDIHPTMKPVKLMGELVQNSSKPGEKVIDFFSGSGSTLMACEQLGRKCYAMEYDPVYLQASLDRYEQYTGKKAVKIK